MQVVYWGIVLETILIRNLCKAGLGKGEGEIGCIVALASADPLVCSEAGMTFQNCPELRQKDLAFASSTSYSQHPLWLNDSAVSSQQTLLPAAQEMRMLALSITASIAIGLFSIWKGNLPALLWLKGFCRRQNKVMVKSRALALVQVLYLLILHKVLRCLRSQFL